MKQMIEDESINTDEYLVASTYMNAEFKYLNRKLSVANAMLNRSFNPQYQKDNSSRIVFYCFNEKSVTEKTHSHLFLSYPDNLNLQDIVDKMKELFLYLDDRTNPKRKHKNSIYHATIDDQFAYGGYCLKDYDVENTDTFCEI